MGEMVKFVMVFATIKKERGKSLASLSTSPSYRSTVRAFEAQGEWGGGGSPWTFRSSLASLSPREILGQRVPALGPGRILTSLFY